MKLEILEPFHDCVKPSMSRTEEVKLRKPAGIFSRAKTYTEYQTIYETREARFTCDCGAVWLYRPPIRTMGMVGYWVNISRPDNRRWESVPT